MAGWRLARSLERLRDQINARYPARNKASDGTIGDIHHRSRVSDHNAWLKDAQGIGVVSAFDATHDMRNGVDTWALAEHLRQCRDSRLKYCISNHKIFSATTAPFTWRRYTGSNPHVHHVHISVQPLKALYDDAREWDIDYGSPIAPLDDVLAANPDSPALRPLLRLGSTGEDVKTLQWLLVLSLVDGIFGPITEAAVRAFQRHEKLAVDGIVGPSTWRVLDTIEQIPLVLNYAPPRELSEPVD